MFNKIRNYIVYKRRLKFLKMYTVNMLANAILNNHQYIDGFIKLSLTASSTNDPVKLQSMLNEYSELVKMTKNVNRNLDNKENK